MNADLHPLLAVLLFLFAMPFANATALVFVMHAYKFLKAA